MKHFDISEWEDIPTKLSRKQIQKSIKNHKFKNKEDSYPKNKFRK